MEGDDSSASGGSNSQRGNRPGDCPMNMGGHSNRRQSDRLRERMCSGEAGSGSLPEDNDDDSGDEVLPQELAVLDAILQHAVTTGASPRHLLAMMDGSGGEAESGDSDLELRPMDDSSDDAEGVVASDDEDAAFFSGGSNEEEEADDDDDDDGDADDIYNYLMTTI